MQVSGRGIELVFRVLLGGIFVYAGATKLMDPGRFAIVIRSYELIGDPWVAWIAMSLPWIEVYAGACVITRVFYRGALLILVAATLMFLIAIVAAWARGLDIECGCFSGKGGTGNYLEIILRDVLFLGVGLFLFPRAKSDAPHPSEE